MARYGIRREADGAWWCGSTTFDADMWKCADFGTFDLADATCRMLSPIVSTLSVALVPDRPNQVQASALVEAERFMAYFAGETGNAFVGSGTPQTCLDEIRNALGR